MLCLLAPLVLFLQIQLSSCCWQITICDNDTNFYLLLGYYTHQTCIKLVCYFLSCLRKICFQVKVRDVTCFGFLIYAFGCFGFCGFYRQFQLVFSLANTISSIPLTRLCSYCLCNNIFCLLFHLELYPLMCLFLYFFPITASPESALNSLSSSSLFSLQYFMYLVRVKCMF